MMNLATQSDDQSEERNPQRPSVCFSIIYSFVFQSKGCQSSCHFYNVLKKESVVPSPLWEFSESAECDPSDPTKIQIRWSVPHPRNGKDPTDTYLLYALFVINDNKPEWTKLAMVSFRCLFVMC